MLVAHGTTFEIWDAEASAEPRLLRSLTADAAGWIRGLAYADVDEDGRAEFVFCSGGYLWAVDSVSGRNDLHLATGDVCVEVAVGNVDADSHLEIAASNGWSGFDGGVVVDGATSEIQWQSPDGFGSTLRIGDLDGDGIGEIVGGGEPGHVRIFDAVTESERLDLGDGSYGVTALRLFDTDGDGLPEILYGTGLGWIRVAGGDGGQRAEIRNHPWPDVGDIAYGDSDGDGENELIWSGGAGSSADDRLYVWDLQRARLEASTLELNAPYYGFAAGDLDADGSAEILHTLYSTASSGPGRLVVRGAASHQEQAMLIPAPSGFDQECTRLALGQLDGDPALEIVVAAGRRITAFDGATFAPQWSAPIPENVQAMGLAVADLDRDGRPEVVVASRRASSNSSPPQRVLSVFGGRTGVLAWQSPEIGWGELNYAFLRIAEVDGDAALEILVGEDDGSLEIWDGASHLQQLAASGLRVTALDTADLDGDGIAEIYVGSHRRAAPRRPGQRPAARLLRHLRRSHPGSRGPRSRRGRRARAGLHRRRQGPALRRRGRPGGVADAAAEPHRRPVRRPARRRFRRRRRARDLAQPRRPRPDDLRARRSLIPRRRKRPRPSFSPRPG